jgi:hypothetical protein
MNHGGRNQVSRRTFVNSAALAGVALAAPASAQRTDESLPPLARPGGPPQVVATDEAFWRRVAAYYRVSDRVTNLEAGYWGMMAAPVLAEYLQHVERVNAENSFYARQDYLTDFNAVRTRSRH